MQTFMPYNSFFASASSLDRLRLGKQRTECKQILECLGGVESAQRWKNHPAVLMWAGYEEALRQYSRAVHIEWRSRGYKDGMIIPPQALEYKMPLWMGDERLHASHRSNLLRKDPIWYGKFGWPEPSNMDYFWPVERTR